MAEVDLHLHTTASDGRLTPRQLVALLAQRGLKVVAVTDHDSTQGLAEAQEAARALGGPEIIPGIELSTDVPGNEIHILGYLMDYHAPSFQAELTRFREGREGRARRMVEKLRSLGVEIDFERVKAFAGDGAIGRPHIALAMKEKGYITEIPEAFDRYIGRNGPAYVERLKLTPADAIRFLAEYGGVAVLAHPGDLPELDQVVEELKAAGLVGMEVHYAQYTPERIAALARVAERHGLLPCGGSDYHALGSPNERLPGEMGPPLWVPQELRRLARERAAARQG